MVGEDAAYRWWCVTCNVRHPHDVKHRTAVNKASDHAAKNGGHTVFILRGGKATLEVFWFPPHNAPPLKRGIGG
jgi:heterodisulfide reductase subunit C